MRVGWGHRMCGCDKTLKAFWKRVRDTPEARVTADTSWPSVLPMLHKVLETDLFHSLLVLIYTFLKHWATRGLWKDARLGHLDGADRILQGASICKSPTSSYKKPYKKLPAVPESCLIQGETVSHSITCSMCTFQCFMHAGFWADLIFHTRILISTLKSLPI